MLLAEIAVDKDALYIGLSGQKLGKATGLPELARTSEVVQWHAAYGSGWWSVVLLFIYAALSESVSASTLLVAGSIRR